MSLKDEIQKSLDSFTSAVTQEIENRKQDKEDLKNDLMDLVNSDADEEVNEQKEKTGCLLWTVIKYVFIILVIVIFLRNGCSFNSSIKRDDAAQQSSYDNAVSITKKNIKELTSQTDIDTDALENEYEYLLACKASEYAFKCMAHGHFLGEYTADKYDHILEECNQIKNDMAKHLGSAAAEELWAFVAIKAYEEYDDVMIDYDELLIGEKESPDIDAMWNAYFDSLVQD